MSLAEIQAAIPHRPPFLLVDEIALQHDNRIVCRKQFSGDEWFFAGHYPDEPLVPGVLLCEAALQAGAILLGKDRRTEKDSLPVVTRINDVRFKHLVKPGDTIEIEVELRERLAEAYFFTAKVNVSGKVAARLEFACMMVAKSEAAT
jgi:3-hydroxyacyl-[acyl-carrier-protein] dehydratase